jgi:predicted dithiol-disulfide oxidoreductase (DUF899 family)
MSILAPGVRRMGECQSDRAKEGVIKTTLEDRTVVSHDEWIEARRQFLTKEKEFTRLRDQLSQQRRDLPWERVEREYVFDGPNGRETLSDLFAGESQLIVYHFMFGPDWRRGARAAPFSPTTSTA